MCHDGLEACNVGNSHSQLFHGPTHLSPPLSSRGVGLRRAAAGSLELGKSCTSAENKIKLWMMMELPEYRSDLEEIRHDLGWLAETEDLTSLSPGAFAANVRPWARRGRTAATATKKRKKRRKTRLLPLHGGGQRGSAFVPVCLAKAGQEEEGQEKKGQEEKEGTAQIRSLNLARCFSEPQVLVLYQCSDFDDSTQCLLFNARQRRSQAAATAAAAAAMAPTSHSHRRSCLLSASGCE